VARFDSIPKTERKFQFDAVQNEPDVNSTSCKMGNRDYVFVLRVNYAQSSLPCVQGQYVQNPLCTPPFFFMIL